jgi:membrane-associated phospholipid phosphatase
MIGIGGITGVLIIICLYMQLPILIIVSFSFVIAGLVGFSRLKLSAHNSSQIYVGFLVGISIQTILFYLAHQTQLL